MPRSFTHDYRSRCIYHITITKAEGIPEFGILTGGIENANVELSSLGKIIVNAIFELQKREPALSILQYIIMPDHIHFLIFVKQRTEKALGSYIGMMKVLSGQNYRKQTGSQATIFKPDFYDKILYPSRSLDIIFKYIRQNPYRLAVRKAYPDFFTRCNNLIIGNIPCQAYGNIHLLDNPFKEQVVVHRADSPEVLKKHKEYWIYVASNGGIMVSPFISAREKEIRKETEAAGGRFILIREKPFAEKEKPAAHDFSLCSEGRMLIIAPVQPYEFSRQSCIMMNNLARIICEKM